jgi:hypothetical protein
MRIDLGAEITKEDTVDDRLADNHDALACLTTACARGGGLS